MLSRGEIVINNLKITLDTLNFAEDELAQEVRAGRSEEMQRLFLTDVMMFATGELIPTTLGGDFRRITGINNFAQAITHRLMTTRGSHPADPSFGVPWDTYLGATYTDRNEVIALLRVDILDEILKDSRASRVTGIDLTFTNHNTLSVVVRLVPIGQREAFSIDFNVVGAS